MNSFEAGFLEKQPIPHSLLRTIRLLGEYRGKEALFMQQTLLLLYQACFEVGRYISLERLIENQREGYYDSLYKSSRGWHEGEHTLLPWWEYFLGVMLLAGYQELECRTGELTTAHGAKTELVLAAIRKLPERFRYADLAQACPNVSRPTIKRVLARFREEGEVECVKSGRDAIWEKKGS